MWKKWLFRVAFVLYWVAWAVALVLFATACGRHSYPLTVRVVAQNLGGVRGRVLVSVDGYRCFETDYNDLGPASSAIVFAREGSQFECNWHPPAGQAEVTPAKVLR